MKQSIWAIIIGVIIIAANLFSLAKISTQPTSLPLVNVAIIVSIILNIGLGAFIIFYYLRKKHIDEANQSSLNVSKPIPNSDEDKDRLKLKRNTILGFVLLIEFIGSVQVWILNNYTAGLTLINLLNIFDICINLVLLYIAIQLFLKRTKILHLLFYTVIIYALGDFVLYGFRHHWYTAFVDIAISGYFVFAIKAPVNRKNFRIAHFVILPIIIILIALGSYFDNGQIDALSKKESLLEQEFANESTKLSSAYVLFLQKDVPDKILIQEIRDSITKRDKKIQDIITVINDLENEYKMQIATVSQKEMLEKLRYLLLIINIDKEQGKKLDEFMQYAEKVNFKNLTDSQRQDMLNLKNAVDDYTNQLTKAQFDLSNANLVY